MEKYLLALIPFAVIGWIVLWSEMGLKDKIPLWLAFTLCFATPVSVLIVTLLYFLPL